MAGEELRTGGLGGGRQPGKCHKFASIPLAPGSYERKLLKKNAD